MELGDYLRIIGRRWWLIVLVTALAGVLIAVLYPPEDKFVTVATVQVDTETMSSNDRLDFIANFETAVTQRSVLTEVSEETGVPTGEISRRLTSGRVGGGTFVRLRDEADSLDPEEAQALVQSMAESAVTFVNGPRIQAIQAEVDAAQTDLNLARDAVNEARGAVDVAVEAAGGVDPAVTSQLLQTRIQTLQLQLLNAETLAERSETQDALDDSVNQLPQAERAARNFEELVQAQTSAETARGSAFNSLNRAEANLAEVLVPPTVVFQRVGEETAASPSLVQRVVAAAAVGFLLSAGLVLAIDIARDRGRPKRRRAEDRPLADLGVEPNGDMASPYPDVEVEAHEETGEAVRS